MTVDHKEKEFERSIVEHLVKHSGYSEGKPGDYDTHNALLAKTVIAFIKDSQPKAWERLATVHQANFKGLCPAVFACHVPICVPEILPITSIVSHCHNYN